MQSDLWVVLLSYNGLEDTRKCLRSLEDAKGPAFSTVVVDNGSEGDDAAAVRQEFPWCHAVRLSSNVGASGGNNRGVEYALREGAAQIVLLNNDTVVSSGFLGRLADAAASNPAFGIVGPIINYMDEPEVVMTDGVRFNPPEFPGFFARHPVPPSITDPPSVTEVDIVNACCMLVRAEVFRRVGLFDERFFIYHDETDFCLRARSAGFRCGVLAESLVWHKGGSSTKRSGRPLPRYYDSRNLGLVLLKHRGAGHNGRRPASSAVVYLKYLYYRYCLECEERQPAAALAVIEGLCDVIAGRYGRRSERHRPGAAGVRLLFEAVRSSRARLAQIGR